MKYKGIAFFDIDGVLADCRHRLHYNEEKDYDNFYSDENILLDTPIRAGISLMEIFMVDGFKILIISNRRNVCREATMKWLGENGLTWLKSEDLYLKGFGDTRKSWDVKKDLLFNAIEDNMELYRDGEKYFIDDYPQNCEMVENCFPGIKPIIFGCGRLNDGQKS